jgi:hypothetical protein
MQKGFLVENFGQVRGNQSYPLNFHLAEATKAFDREYQRTSGPLGTAQHELDRYEFQRFVAKQLLDLFQDDDGEILSIRTTTDMSVNHDRQFIEVVSESTFKKTRACAALWIRPTERLLSKQLLNAWRKKFAASLVRR